MTTMVAHREARILPQIARTFTVIDGTTCLTVHTAKTAIAPVVDPTEFE